MRMCGTLGRDLPLAAALRLVRLGALAPDLGLRALVASLADALVGPDLVLTGPLGALALGDVAPRLPVPLDLVALLDADDLDDVGADLGLRLLAARLERLQHAQVLDALVAIPAAEVQLRQLVADLADLRQLLIDEGDVAGVGRPTLLGGQGDVARRPGARGMQVERLGFQLTDVVVQATVVGRGVEDVDGLGQLGGHRVELVLELVVLALGVDERRLDVPVLLLQDLRDVPAGLLEVGDRRGRPMLLGPHIPDQRLELVQTRRHPTLQVFELVDQPNDRVHGVLLGWLLSERVVVSCETAFLS